MFWNCRARNVLHRAEHRASNPLRFGRFSQAKDFVVNRVRVRVRVAAIGSSGSSSNLFGRRNQFVDGLTLQIFFKIDCDEDVLNPVGRIDRRNVYPCRTSQYQPATISTTVANVDYIIAIAHRHWQIPFPC